MSIEPRNLTAQLHHRAAGNPPSTLPDSAISNCFPGLEFDFRNVWRRIFEGIEMHEANGFVVRAEASVDPARRTASCVAVAGVPDLARSARTDGHRGGRAAPGHRLARMVELARRRAGGLGRRAGAGASSSTPRSGDTETVELRVRPILVRSPVTGELTPVIDEVVAEPGELTQSLCSPWQNDYRECGCYYWAASRPGLRQRRADGAGASIGNNWLARSREPKRYVPDNADDRRQLDYEDLFRDWEGCCGSSSRAATMTELFELSAPRSPHAHLVDSGAGPAPVPAERQPAVRRRRGRPDRLDALQRAGDEAALADLLARLGVDAPAYVDDTPLTEPPVRALSLAVAQKCNLGCTYCYAEGGSFGGPARTCRMATALASVDLLLSAGRPRGAGQPRLPRRRAAGQPRRAPRGHRARARPGRRARRRRHASRSPPTARC